MVSKSELLSSNENVVLRLQNISKDFGAIKAVEDVSFDVRGGEIVAIVGDNGAGKSTLVKIISGLYQPSGGNMVLDGKNVVFESPKGARQSGVETVYQDLALVEQLGVAGNFYLGREIFSRNLFGRFLGWLSSSLMHKNAVEALRSLHIKIPDFRRSVGNMSGGQRQAVAIGRTIFWGQKLMVLDEPTAALGVEESEQVLQVLEGLDKDKMPIIFVSHNMHHVHRVADRIIVMRSGRLVADLDKLEVSPEEIVAYITGVKSATGAKA